MNMNRGTKISEDEFNKRQERGRRARIIREEILEVTRAYLSQKYGVSVSTIQSWEDANFGGMTDSGAQKLTDIFAAEGINVKPEWLMYGLGEVPEILIKKGLAEIVPIPNISEEQAIIQEIKLFYQHTSNAVHAIVTDDGMLPWLAPGDYVAGQWFFDQDIQHHLGHPSIVKTLPGGILIRLVELGDKPDHYTLTYTNPNTTLSDKIMSNVKLACIAPIKWIRKLKLSDK